MLHDYIKNLSEAEYAKLRVDSVDALRKAWAHRHTLRGRIVVESNVKMLRRLS